MNYFDLYGIPISFEVNHNELKKKFLELSKQHHPDLFVNEAADKQAEALQLSTLNTRAFQTLSNFDRRMKYILELKEQIHEGERYQLSPDFLMEMMDINEAVMELKMDAGGERIEGITNRLSALFKELDEEIKNELELYDEDIPASSLRKIKDYYYRKKYLLRIQESLDSFARQA